MTSNREKQPYLASLTRTADGWEQQLEANALAFLPDEADQGIHVFLGDLDGKLPIHSVRLSLPSTAGGSFQCELNDQRNQRDARDVASLELGQTHLRIRFRSSRGPWSGRVSLARSFDPLVGKPRKAQLTSVTVWLERVAAELPRFHQLLQQAHGLPTLRLDAPPPKRVAPTHEHVVAPGRSAKPSWRTFLHADGRRWSVRISRGGFELRIELPGEAPLVKRRKTADAASEVEALIAEQRAEGFSPEPEQSG